METLLDPNNNTSGEKSYSLRPRASQKKDDEETDLEDSWRPRGRVKRRCKQKSLPLSKYRRKTANARERSRMREINEAFEALRRALPHYNAANDNPNEKTTKIMTLRLAMKYISALNHAIRQADLDSDGESLVSDYGFNHSAGRENSLTPSSISEQSDIFDQLFVNSSLEDYPLSSSSVSPFMNENVKSPCGSVSTTSTSDFNSSNLISLKSPLRTHLSRPLVKSSSDNYPNLYNLFNSKPSRLPSYSSLVTTTVTPPLHTNSFSSSVSSSLTVQGDVSEPDTTPWRDFDCLPSSPVNLDDLFIS